MKSATSRPDSFALAAILSLILGPGAVFAGESVQRIGTHPDLSAGAMALRLGRYAEGIELTQAGLKSATSAHERARALSNLCAGYTAMRRYAEAVRHCNRAIDIDDRNWRTYNNRALALLGLKRIGAARRDLEKGLSLNADAHNLAQVAELIEIRSNGLRLATQ